MNFTEIKKQKDADYILEIDKIDRQRVGVEIKCPKCQSISWTKFPETRYWELPIRISCPTACGAYFPIEDFLPRPQIHIEEEYDYKQTCKRDGQEYSSNGAFFKCPMCSIENPREVMGELVEYTNIKLADNSSQDSLEELLAKIVGVFDGVMRKSHIIASQNAVELSHPPLPQINSFQNVAKAKEKLLPLWDMSKCVTDWEQYIITFQKRHLYAHALGVADVSYINSSGDQAAVIGKKVRLSSQEIKEFSANSYNIVKSYFGNFLS